MVGSIERAVINEDGSLGAFSVVGTMQNKRRGSMPALLRGNDLYLAGGSCDGCGEVFDTIDRYVLDVGGSITYHATYELKVNGTKIKFSSYGGAVVGSGLLLVGGEQNGDKQNNAMTLPIAADGAVGSGAWAPYHPGATFYATNASIPVVDGRVYVASGEASAIHGQVWGAPIGTGTGAITGSWTRYPDQKTPSAWGGGLVAVGRRLYTFGGYINDTDKAHARIQTATIDPSNGAVSKWSYYGGMTERRYGQVSVVLGNKAWHVGGWNDNGSMRSSEYFSLYEDGSYGPSTVGPDLTAERYYAGGAAAKGFLYVIGGRDSSNNTCHDMIDRAAINADGTLGPFSRMPNRLNRGRGWHQCAAAGDYLYCFGGEPTDGGAVDSIERARINQDGSLSAFELLPAGLPGGYTYMGAPALVGDRLYLTAGADSSNNLGHVLSARIAPDGTLGAFSRGPDLGTKVKAGAVRAIGNYLYVFGGWGSGGPVGRVQRPRSTRTGR